MMSDCARYWMVDLHTHTPASLDVSGERYGATTPEEFVAAAVAAGLDAIAVTDHNTTDWCDSVRAAAADAALLVLPGVEISTSEGHLLAIFEEDTPASRIDEVLVLAGIRGEDRGRLDIATEKGMADVAHLICESGGLAIAAHVDAPRGLLELQVAAHVKRLLCDTALSALEVVDLAECERIQRKVGDDRHLPFVRGSDAMSPDTNGHRAAGLGSRRTWVKAARPDLTGIAHALNDPTLRVRLEAPPAASQPVIESLSIEGGFLGGVSLPLSPDLNCLLGGTGAGKSLVLEALRYVLDQQVDGEQFPAIWSEVDSRLRAAIGTDGVVRADVLVEGERYSFERVVTEDLDGVITASRLLEGSWVELDTSPAAIVSIQAFSQGEALEYSRQPVGRMRLVDAGLDLSGYEARESDLIEQLRTNASELLEQRAEVNALEESAKREADLAERVRELSEFFEGDIATAQQAWATEERRMAALRSALPSEETLSVALDAPELGASAVGNDDLVRRADEVMRALSLEVARASSEMLDKLQSADQQLRDVETEFKKRHADFKKRLDDELAKLESGASLQAVRAELERNQGLLADAREAKARLQDMELPRLSELMDERESLLNELHEVRMERRRARRVRAKKLNEKCSGIVKLDVPDQPDVTHYRERLDQLKVGSRVREDVLDSLSTNVSPLHLVRTLFAGDPQDIARNVDGVDPSSIARLHANIEDRDLWAELLEMQDVSQPDRLNIKFRKPEDGSYAPIEQLSHGQRCTAVLVMLLADGDAPVIVDQPEDALHAPWIEEYLVDRLRALRGSRQYVFATRSPGIVVGADAEQLVTMRATAGRGEIEALGSLERFDLNKLALHHLEGGRAPYLRRSSKLQTSVRSP